MKRTPPLGHWGYKEIAADLEGQIRSGTLPPDTKLPSRAKLAARYGVSGTTVSRALGLLDYVGLTVGKQGKGVFVADSAR